MASLDPLQSCLGKLSDAMDDAGVPPGFVESLKLKFSNILQENALERVNGDGDIYLKSYPMEVKTELQNSDNLEQDFSPKLHTKSPRQGELVPRFPSPDDGVRLNVAGVLKGHLEIGFQASRSIWVSEGASCHLSCGVYFRA